MGFFDDPNIGASRIEDSQSRGGRANLFNSFLANNSAFGALTNRGKSLIGNTFNPLSAQYALRNANNPEFGVAGYDPGASQDFRQFLQNAPQPQSRSDLLSQIQGAAGLFPRGGLSGGTLAQEAARDSLSDDVVGGNITTQAMLAGMNPFLRNTGQRVAENRINAFRDTNTGMSLFEALLNGQFGSGFTRTA
jgi:hypothetical protein